MPELTEIGKTINGVAYIIRYDENGVWRESAKPGEQRKQKY